MASQSNREYIVACAARPPLHELHMLVVASATTVELTNGKKTGSSSNLVHATLNAEPAHVCPNIQRSRQLLDLLDARELPKASVPRMLVQEVPSCIRL